MNHQPTINYPDTLGTHVPYKYTRDQHMTPQQLVGGHVEFSVLDETYVHFFTLPQELQEIAYYITTGKPMAGLRQFIVKNYAHIVKQKFTEEQIIIWNYEFDLSGIDKE
jgi:hypothetical protein